MRVVVSAALSIASIACGTPVEAPRDPVPAGLATLDAAECGGCHADALREWHRSAHAAAWRDPLFVAEHEPRRDPWCTSCHAPRSRDAGRDPEAEAGVDCASCHVRDGHVVAERVSGRAPHASRADPSRAGVGACARCHQFDRAGQPGMPMQDTVTELRASSTPDAACTSCHDPHAAPGHRDPTLLARALDVSARAHLARGGTEVTLTLASRAAHGVPTGDVFRRLEVIAEVEDSAARAWLGRRFRLRGREWAHVESDAVPPTGAGARTVTLFVPRRGTRARWSIRLWSMPPRRAEAEGFAPETVVVPVAEGAVPIATSG